MTATRGFCPGCDGDGDMPSVLPGLSVHQCGTPGLSCSGTTSQPAASHSWAAVSPWEKGAGEGDTQTWWGEGAGEAIGQFGEQGVWRQAR